MEKTPFIVLIVTSTLGSLLATVGYFSVEVPAEIACDQLLQTLGADTTAVRHGAPSLYVELSSFSSKGILRKIYAVQHMLGIKRDSNCAAGTWAR